MKPTLKKPTIAAVSTSAAALAFAGQKPEGETIRVNAEIRAELHKALKIRSANEGKSIKVLIEDWIESWAKH